MHHRFVKRVDNFLEEYEKSPTGSDALWAKLSCIPEEVPKPMREHVDRLVAAASDAKCDVELDAVVSEFMIVYGKYRTKMAMQIANGKMKQILETQIHFIRDREESRKIKPGSPLSLSTVIEQLLRDEYDSFDEIRKYQSLVTVYDKVIEAIGKGVDPAKGLAKISQLKQELGLIKDAKSKGDS